MESSSVFKFGPIREDFGAGGEIPIHVNFQQIQQTKKNVNKVFKCVDCNLIFANQSSYTAHKRKHAVVNRCEYCDEELETPRDLSIHFLHEHTGVDSGNLHCLPCDQFFQLETELRNHIRKEHTNPFRPDTDTFAVKVKKRSPQKNTKRSKESKEGNTFNLTKQSPKKETDSSQQKEGSETNLKGKKRRYFKMEFSNYKPTENDATLSVVEGGNSIPGRDNKILKQGEENFTCSEADATDAESDILKKGYKIFKPEDETGDSELSRLKPYQCQHCSKYFEIESEVLAHIDKAHVRKKREKLQCPHCPQTYYEKFKMHDHILIHSNPSAFQCNVCKLNLSSKRALIAHMEIHSDFECKICGQTFETKIQSLFHSLEHEGLAPYDCNYCGKLFPRDFLLRKHIKDVHVNTKDHCCTHCERSFSSRGRLNSHVKQVHTRELKYHCTECSYKCQSHGVLNLHMFVHTRKGDYKCHLCPNEFPNVTRLQKHLITHTGEKSYHCEQCSKSWRYRGSLVLHNAIHHENNRVKCAQCDKEFSCQKLLRRHIRSKHDGKDENGVVIDKKFVDRTKLKNKKKNKTPESAKTTKDHCCTHCGRCFISRKRLNAHVKQVHIREMKYHCTECSFKCQSPAQLKLHMFVHTRKGEYKCHLCPNEFPNVTRLQKHLITHTGEKTFHCEQCSKSWRYRGSLVLHNAIHHENNRVKCAQCDKEFSCQKFLRRHIRSKHDGKDENGVVIDKKFVDRTNLKSKPTDAVKTMVITVSRAEEKKRGTKRNATQVKSKSSKIEPKPLSRRSVKKSPSLKNNLETGQTQPTEAEKTMLITVRAVTENKKRGRKRNATKAKSKSPVIQPKPAKRRRETFDCQFCEKIFKNPEERNAHMEQHTSSILQNAAQLRNDDRTPVERGTDVTFDSVQMVFSETISEAAQNLPNDLEIKQEKDDLNKYFSDPTDMSNTLPEEIKPQINLNTEKLIDIEPVELDIQPERRSKRQRNTKHKSFASDYQYFQCEICPLYFSSITMLNRHLLSHVKTEPAPNPTYTESETIINPDTS